MVLGSGSGGHVRGRRGHGGATKPSPERFVVAGRLTRRRPVIGTALLLLGCGALNGVAIVPMVGIVLGGTMTAVAVAARRALDTLGLRVGEVEAALSLGINERDSRMEIIGRSAADALLPNLDQTRTVGIVTLPGAFVGVLLSTGSPVQAGAVQILILLALLLSQTCAVAATIELIARGAMAR